jgi:hypothetical protein
MGPRVQRREHRCLPAHQKKPVEAPHQWRREDEALRQMKWEELEGLRPTKLEGQEAHAKECLGEREQACQAQRTP